MAYDLSQLKTAAVLTRSAGKRSRTLIVLVHGWRLDNTQWRSLLELAGADPEFNDCDFYLFSFQASFRLRSGLDQLGRVLAGGVDLHTREDGAHYERIILIGYSIGGLIVRAALLVALGVAGGGTHEWASRVTRIVLMATPNRGLGGTGTPWVSRLGVWMMRFLGGRLLRDAIKGSDFITRLRLDWVYAFRDPATQTPEVVQLLGMEDEFVRPEDNMDVTTFREAKLFMLPSGRHANLAAFTGHNDPKYKRLRMSCFGPIGDVDGDEPRPSAAPSAVLFTLHGIRDYGGWLGKFAQTVQQVDPTVRVVGPGYGWFSLLGFVTPWVRRKRIAWFCDRYTEEMAALATSTEVVPFYFVGHSYGTYLLAECLKRFPRMQFERACLVGSVVPDTFNWREIIQTRRQVNGLRNDCASLDWPVAICCRVLNQVGFRDLGIGGFVGFRVGTESAIDYLHVPGNHSATLTDERIRRGAVEYLLYNKTVPPPTVVAPRWLQLASRWALPLVVLIMLIVTLAGETWFHELAPYVSLDPHLGLVTLFAVILLVLIYI